MNRILKVAGKPCSCPEGRICHACTAKKKKFSLKPRIHVTQSRNPHVPIKITHFAERNKRTIKESEKPDPREFTGLNISKWYRRHKAAKELKSYEKKSREEYIQENKILDKALKQFKQDQKKIKKEQEQIEKERLKLLLLERVENAKREKELAEQERKKAIQDREKEVLEYFVAQEEHQKSYYTPQLRAQNNTYDIIEETTRKEKKPKKEKKSKKEKKPKKEKKLKKIKVADNKSVLVKKYNSHESWKDRFSHWFYRFFCKLYFYVSCVLALVFVIIFIL